MTARRLRVAMVAPVAQPVPPEGSGSVETATALLVDGLVALGHEVTLFAVEGSRTGANLHVTFTTGYHHDASLWPWQLCELLNLAAAVERADRFDLIHYQAEDAPLSLGYVRTCPRPLVQTVHHNPGPDEVALWARYPEAPFVAISETQARQLAPLNVVATIPHAVDADAFTYRAVPDDYLLFLGRFTEGKGVLPAIEVARRTGRPLVLAGPRNDYFDDAIAPLVNDRDVRYAGEVWGTARDALLGGARALLYPVQEAEPFGLVLIEAMACGTPVAALARGAVTEIVEPGGTGHAFDTLDALVHGLPAVLALDRARIRTRVTERFGPRAHAMAHVALYERLCPSATER